MHRTRCTTHIDFADKTQNLKEMCFQKGFGTSFPDLASPIPVYSPLTQGNGGKISSYGGDATPSYWQGN